VRTLRGTRADVESGLTPYNGDELRKFVRFFAGYGTSHQQETEGGWGRKDRVGSILKLREGAAALCCFSYTRDARPPATCFREICSRSQANRKTHFFPDPLNGRTSNRCSTAIGHVRAFRFRLM
jgi:hypothetical protein